MSPLLLFPSPKQWRHKWLSTRRSKHPPPSEQDMALMEFLQEDCPLDVVPKILAFCGPQTVAAFSQTNRHWRDICFNDATWRILCEELYKWSSGDDLPSISWREYYQQNPCVPIDYSTLPAALATVEQNTLTTGIQHQTQSIRILLRPGDHILTEAIVIQAMKGVTVTIETMKGNFASNHVLSEEEHVNHITHKKSPTRRLTRMRNRMNCRSLAAQDYPVELEHPVMERLSSSRPTTDCATLILQTRKHNEPLFRVQQGNLKLANLQLLHNCHGMDIWNGNAAIQIQPPKNLLNITTTTTLVRPCVIMTSLEVISHSGRGIVNIDGGFALIRNSYVHDCAATGIYVGGPGTQAVMERTDVLHNGSGTRNRRGGIGRGHSGVYLEQGKAIIRDCNISRNSLTGISAVSLHNTFLNLEQSDLVANGTAQLEMPHGAPMSMDLQRNNRLAAIGLLRSRSGLVQEPALIRELQQQRPETAL